MHVIDDQYIRIQKSKIITEEINIMSTDAVSRYLLVDVVWTMHLVHVFLRQKENNKHSVQMHEISDYVLNIWLAEYTLLLLGNCIYDIIQRKRCIYNFVKEIQDWSFKWSGKRVSKSQYPNVEFVLDKKHFIYLGLLNINLHCEIDVLWKAHLGNVLQL